MTLKLAVYRPVCLLYTDNDRPGSLGFAPLQQCLELGSRIESALHDSWTCRADVFAQAVGRGLRSDDDEALGRA